MSFRFDLRVMTSVLWVGLPLLAGAAQPSSSAGVAARYSAAARYMESPIRFEANKGQAPKGVDYISLGTRHSLYLQKSGVRLDVPGQDRPESIVLKYVKPEVSRRSEGVDQIGSKSSYLIGPNPDHWFYGISSYRKVRYNNVWSGIDVVYYGNHSRLEYDLVVAAGADVDRAAFQISGAKALKIDQNGDLLIQTASGDIVQHRPVAYQNTRQGRREVEARYAISGHTVSFRTGRYDHSLELVIDPTIAFSIPRVITQGASYGVEGTAVVVDALGNTWVTGNTLPAFQQPNTQTFYTGVFVNEYNIFGVETSEQVVFGALDGNTTASGIGVDNGGSVYITGATSSVTGLPITKNAYQSTNAGGVDAYLIRLNFVTTPQSPVVYCTYLGGSGNDQGNAMVVDTAGNAYVAGQTSSSNFPQTLGNPYAGEADAFLVKINTNSAAAAASLVYSYLTGGSGNDAATSVAMDTNGFLYVGGATQSTSFLPNPNFGFVTSNPSIATVNGFLLKVNAASPAASYLTFYSGGPVSAVAADSTQQAYVTGQSTGAIPTNSVNAGYNPNGGAGHAFVARFSTTVNGAGSLIYSTYLAGAATDAGAGIGVDGSGNATVVGTTNSTNFPLAGSPLDSALIGATDAFVSKIATNASASESLVYSSYLGGSGSDGAYAVGMTPYGNPVITGMTTSPNFPVTPGGTLDGRSDQRAFVTKLYYETAPFGSLDTPANNTTGAAGEINVTGWALSPIAIGSVQIWRNPVNSETPSPNGLIYIETAEQVPDSRPDVATSYPGYPNNNWGWGVQVLSNELPGVGGNPIGNGTYTLHALAFDNDGYVTDIGQATVTVNNAGSVLPFGTIDTPAAGATISGTSYVNFGWALTPQPASIPTNGSTITVFIDLKPQGHPVYNNPRSDIETLFPGYANTDGAIGYYRINTTQFANGLHQISWTVTDSAGHKTGIGSRDFLIQN